MTDMWMLAIATVPAVVATLREVAAVRRYRVRRASIERVLGSLGSGSRVVDQDPGGAVIDVTIDRCACELDNDTVREQRESAA